MTGFEPHQRTHPSPAGRFELTARGLPDLLRWMQDGVVTRQQLIDHGATDHDIRRLVRRNELRRLHPGVFVNHTGELTLRQRQWAAVFALWPAALAGESALPVKQGPVIHVAVEAGRRLEAPPRVVLHHVNHLRERVDGRARPPRLRVEHATLDAMASRIQRDDVPGAFALLAEVSHQHDTLHIQLLAALAARERISGRATIEGMITDLRDGACSVLERGYLQLVERTHGLPRATRQRTSHATGRRSVQDVRYDDFGVIVELDGLAFHDNPRARDTDARRDLAELANSNAVTARVTYGLVFREPCLTAMWIARILRRHGWRGHLRRCPSCPSH